MPDIDINIPSPTLTGGDLFDVVIKDHTGAIVFGPDTETNATFTVTGLTAGDYTMEVTYHGHTNIWCFTISACECPDFTGAEVIRNEAGLYYLYLYFDFDLGFPDCPFTIRTHTGSGVTSAIVNHLITDLGEFVSTPGHTYTYIIFLGAPSVTYSIYTGDSGEIECVPPTTVTYACTPASLPRGGFTPTLVHELGVYYLRFVVNDCGGTCHGLTVNYMQNNTLHSGAEDIGTVSITLNCSSTYPFTVSIPVSPNTDIFTATPVYNVSMTDCCGNAYIANGVGLPSS